ncbi:PQQ-dependent sugar dehydrogenase [Rubrobacter marinus]|uniref:PQQ-dependent sugar dehydrogenase n=1 Tax=Rubrobacter marinus TaxID=2653852 RepID=UPI0014098350|nr:PQQ-dependent sugar dehydrogenase [Rubrobacter marinus]
MVLALVAGIVPILLVDAQPASGQAATQTQFTQPGFTDTLVTNVDAPTALAFTPDGRLLITNQQGQLRVYDDDRLLPTPALNISGRVCANSERGLLGVAVDREFAANRYVYLYYTANTGSRCVNRVSRFVLGNDNVARDERILLNNMYSGTNHNAGDVKVGKDGLIYASIGDGGRPRDARNKSVLLGKVLRVARDGSIPASNPYRGSGTARCGANGQASPGVKCQEIFASGFRNPFRMGFDPNYASTRFFVNDVGQTKWEEVNLARAGADYGWDLREGPCAKDSYTVGCGAAPAGLTNPIYSYKHSTNCSSITGGVVLPNGSWPGAVNSSYLFGDFVCGRIFKLTQTSTGFKPSTFAYNMEGGGPVALTFGPDNALYYTTYAGGGIHRISHNP